jgi:hypothetical protein
MMIDGWERIWKESVVSRMRYFPRNLLVGAEKTCEQVTLSDTLARIRTRYFTHTDSVLYRCNRPLSVADPHEYHDAKANKRL